MKVVLNFVAGPFRNETEFKSAAMERLSSLFITSGRWFRIETEETEPGMPDTAFFPFPGAISRGQLIEYKISDERGRIKFKRSQPLFYRQNMRLNILIMAWDRRYNRVVQISPEEVVAGKSLTMWIPEGIVESYSL